MFAARARRLKSKWIKKLWLKLPFRSRKNIYVPEELRVVHCSAMPCTACILHDKLFWIVQRISLGPSLFFISFFAHSIHNMCVCIWTNNPLECKLHVIRLTQLPTILFFLWMCMVSWIFSQKKCEYFSFVDWIEMVFCGLLFWMDFHCLWLVSIRIYAFKQNAFCILLHCT